MDIMTVVTSATVSLLRIVAIEFGTSLRAGDRRERQVFRTEGWNEVLDALVLARHDQALAIFPQLY
jgi:hypothetical protein